jgi:hypothetical protein
MTRRQESLLGLAVLIESTGVGRKAGAQQLQLLAELLRAAEGLARKGPGLVPQCCSEAVLAMKPDGQPEYSH